MPWLRAVGEHQPTQAWAWSHSAEQAHRAQGTVARGLLNQDETGFGGEPHPAPPLAGWGASGRFLFLSESRLLTRVMTPFWHRHGEEK